MIRFRLSCARVFVLNGKAAEIFGKKKKTSAARSKRIYYALLM